MCVLLAAPSADAWRYASAVVSVLVLLAITAALVVHSSTMSRPWLRVLGASVFQQAVLAYAAVVRAKNTPPGFPSSHPDVALVLIVLSGISLLLCVLGVFASAHPEPRRRRA